MYKSDSGFSDYFVVFLFFFFECQELGVQETKEIPSMLHILIFLLLFPGG